MAEESKTDIYDYYLTQKVQAWCSSYYPCDDERRADDVMTDKRLRKYFQAYYVQGIGDLLVPYLDALQEHGFKMKTSITGEAAIFVKFKNDEDQPDIDFSEILNLPTAVYGEGEEEE
ncbi:MAG: hypothetical protein IJ557_02715 [Bacteroidaceae bacterium]|nr:hypothetical protein [Bacteroidaceae bacterium]